MSAPTAEERFLSEQEALALARLAALARRRPWLVAGLAVGGGLVLARAGGPLGRGLRAIIPSGSPARPLVALLHSALARLTGPARSPGG